MNQIAKNVVDFYNGKANNDRYTIVEIWAFSLEKLEQTHNYIQYLFPLKEISNSNTNAYLAYSSDILAFRSNPMLKTRMLKSLNVMLNFYGLKYEKKTIIKSSLFNSRKIVWLTPNNHNYLRLTRIITSLGLFGLKHYGDMLFDLLYKLYNENPDKISRKNVEYWYKAAKII